MAGATAAPSIAVVPAGGTTWVPAANHHHLHHYDGGLHGHVYGHHWHGALDDAHSAWVAGHAKVAAENAIHLHSALTNWLAAHAAHAAKNAVAAHNHLTHGWKK